MVGKAASSAADQVFIDLEDAVAPSEKKAARALVVVSLSSLDFGGKVVVVRVNDVTTPFCHGDILEIVSGAGSRRKTVALTGLGQDEAELRLAAETT